MRNYLLVFLGVIFYSSVFAIDLPDQIFLKTPTQTRNNFNEWILIDKEIWVKPLGSNKSAWKKISMVDGPRNPIQIACDGGYFMALNADGQVYTLKSAFKTDPKSFKWNKKWGHPIGMGPGAFLPLDLRGWDFSQLSLKEDKFVLNPATGKKDFYLGNAHIFWLHQNGRWIKFMDPWVVSDHSYEVCGPLRGRFIAINISTAGSLILLINQYGDMYTRMYDFDLAGYNSVYYRYSYNDQTKRTAFYPRQLPLPDWKYQPKISGKITNIISVFKSGEGAVYRELRVEGVNANGQTGYYFKDVNAAQWDFKVTGLPLVGKFIQNNPDYKSDLTLGPSEDRPYSGSEKDFSLRIPNFNVYCSPNTLRISFDKKTFFDFNLHTRGTFRTKPRPRGLSPLPFELNGVIEIPEHSFKELEKIAPAARTFIKKYLGDKRWTEISAEATDTNLTIRKKRDFTFNLKAD